LPGIFDYPRKDFPTEVEQEQNWECIHPQLQDLDSQKKGRMMVGFVVV
jgi:hypothetical protein